MKQSPCELVFTLSWQFIRFTCAIWYNPIQQPKITPTFMLFSFLFYLLSFAINTWVWLDIRNVIQSNAVQFNTMTAALRWSDTSDTLSTNTEHNKLHSSRIYCMTTGNAGCLAAWRLVACAETGCGSKVRCWRTCVPAVCNPEKVILLERCTDFLRAQTLLGKKSNCCEWERIVSLEQYFIIERLSFT